MGEIIVEKQKTVKNLLLLSFFFSGMTALMYEVVWSRPLQLIFGSTIYAVSTIFAAFMEGYGKNSPFVLDDNSLLEFSTPKYLFSKDPAVVLVGVYKFLARKKGGV